MPDILTVHNLSKSYSNGSRTLTVVHGISFQIKTGTSCAIVGPSGSGKTTLLGLCAGLDLPSDGSIMLDGTNLLNLDEDSRSRLRNQILGFVFQNFQLLPTLTALENVMVPLELRGERNAKSHSRSLLNEVGLTDRMNHYPVQLSGGEQQRVALARAFINRPKILFADEPTGNLDSETSKTIENLLFALNKTHGTTLVIATHDMDLAHRTNRMIRLKAGEIARDEMIRPPQKDDN